jgi:hypothetical protein
MNPLNRSNPRNPKGRTGLDIGSAVTRPREAAVSLGLARLKSGPTALRPVLEMAWPRFQHARGQIGEFDKDRAGIAWIDDLLDLEMLGGPEGRSDAVEALFESQHQCLWVVRRVELGPIGGLQTPLDR